MYKPIFSLILQTFIQQAKNWLCIEKLFFKKKKIFSKISQAMLTF